MLKQLKEINKVQLIALPFAGGSSYSYNFLKKQLPRHVYLNTLEYPGRGRRSHEQLVQDAEDLLVDLLNQYKHIVEEAPDDRIVLYGHSLGATLGLELLHQIRELCPWLMPAEAIFTGQGAPRTITRKKISQLPEEEMIAYFIKAGGLSPEAASNPELMAYVLPVLRNDLILLENYAVRYHAKLDVPLSIMIGTEENISAEQFNAWHSETNGTTMLYKLEGNHFFITQNKRFPALISNVCNSQPVFA